MFICPDCKEAFKSETEIVKHLSQCWRKSHPYHKSKPAPQGADVSTRTMSDDVMAFFNSFTKEQ